mgnify:CR=1 FL=1
MSKEFIEKLEIGERAKKLLRDAGVSSLRAAVSYVKTAEPYFRGEVGGDVDRIYEALAGSEKIVIDPTPPGKLGLLDHPVKKA